MLRNAFENLATETSQQLILQAIEDLLVLANRDLSVTAYDLSSAPYSVTVQYDVNAKLDHLLIDFSTIEATDVTVTLNTIVLYSTIGDKSRNININFEGMIVLAGDQLTISIGQTQSSSAACLVNISLTSLHWVNTYASSS